MPKRIDLTGKVYSFLKVIKFVEIDKNGKSTWLCNCICGGKKVLSANRLASGNNKSCGCKRIELIQKHGYSKRFKPYTRWRAMKQRCYDTKGKHYKNYGGRGISVCDRWKNDFTAFWEDMKNGYEDHLTLDRIDVNGNYEPGNCRWATQLEQNNNKRKKTT